jgi:voltage-gated potassium channel
MADQVRARTPSRKIVRSSLRTVGTITVLTTIYFLLPLDHASSWVAVTILGIGLAALIALVVYQVQSVMSSSYPLLRGIESLATCVPLFLLLFASTYLAMENISAKSFSQPLAHTDALYFTVTVFATVGFGDITPTTEAARLVVTGQMIADLVILGIAIKAITSAVQRRRQRR